MKQLLLCCLWLVVLQVSAQTDTLTEYYNEDWKPASKKEAVFYRKAYKDTLWHINDYYISGQLQMRATAQLTDINRRVDTNWFYYENGQLRTRGQWKDGKQVGTWMQWKSDGKQDCKYTFKPDNRMKIAYFHNNGRLSAVEEYQQDSVLISAELWDSTGEISKNRYIEVPATLDGKEDGWNDFLAKHMTYPEDEEGHRMKGRVSFYLLIDETGKASWGGAIGFMHPYLALDFERAIQKMPRWEPLLLHNRPEPCRKRININLMD